MQISIQLDYEPSQYGTICWILDQDNDLWGDPVATIGEYGDYNTPTGDFNATGVEVYWEKRWRPLFDNEIFYGEDAEQDARNHVKATLVDHFATFIRNVA